MFFRNKGHEIGCMLVKAFVSFALESLRFHTMVVDIVVIQQNTCDTMLGVETAQQAGQCWFVWSGRPSSRVEAKKIRSK